MVSREKNDNLQTQVGSLQNSPRPTVAGSAPFVDGTVPRCAAMRVVATAYKISTRKRSFTDELSIAFMCFYVSKVSKIPLATGHNPESVS